MFCKWLAPTGDTGGNGGDNQPPAGDPPAATGQKPPAAGSDTLEKKLAVAEAEVERWKKGYGGLQTILGNKDQELTALTGKLTEKEGALLSLQQTHTQFQTDHKTLAEKAEEMELGLTTTKSQLQRAKVIMKQFPQLAEWEADGQLPETPADAKEDDVVKLFQSFSDKLALVSKANNLGAGGGPPPPAGGGGLTSTADDELKAAKECMKKHDMAGYNAHYAKYLELTIAKK